MVIQSEEEMQMLAEMTEGLAAFARRYDCAISDPELIRRYCMVEDGRRDIATKISAAERRGEERGEKRGANQMNIQNARGFKEKGVDPETISSETGLSLDEIARLYVVWDRG